MKRILITGASGLLGNRLQELLKEKGYGINTLGRKIKDHRDAPSTNINSYHWDIDSGTIDTAAFEGAEAIIHLAGAGVADKPWTQKRKKEIIDSRVKSAGLLFEYLKNHPHLVKTFISAAAVGYYGDCGSETVYETHIPGQGFLAEVCQKWEAAAMQFSKLNIREVRCRIGIVLAKEGGALPELMQSLPFGIAPYFAKSNLYYPWVHIDDVCEVMIHALEKENVQGAYNTSAPQPLLIKDLMKEILKAKNSKALLVPAPPLAIKIALGERSEMVLSSQRCSAEKLLSSGYIFKYREIEPALKSIVQKS